MGMDGTEAGAIDMERQQRRLTGRLRWAGAHRRVRAFAEGRAVADSRDTRIVWEPGRVVAQYAVPIADLDAELVDGEPFVPADRLPGVLTPRNPFAMHSTTGTAWSLRLPSGAVLAGAAFVPDDPALSAHALLDWRAFDEWREEDEVVVGHPHDPFQRIDCLASDQHVVVRTGDVVLAETTRPVLLRETHLQDRWYIPRADVRMDLLVPSDSRTVCAYKGTASYWSTALGDRVISDVAWSYETPLHDGAPIGGMLCFYDDRVTVEVG
ncbi:DUF427 domain-containing protein [Microbacterium capsulatum]|uniref:DUF427 domain-containing protein n=1 Tax=Microbacterium capsulatum TaxID=3041921 RepID=A0ABU0XH26_9MICO|nr:DUF427 domain-containing protein [Microbacterium sp. ASV81]MDQ4214436.1 DUF427 domain-containing protein [Microbacterium sp. ASV81]